VSPSEEQVVDISLSLLGSDLKQSISGVCSVPPGRLKLIMSGRVLKDDVTLDQQNFKVRERLEN
jgi:hypothetical protein